MEHSKWNTLEKIFIFLRFDIQNLNNDAANACVDCLNKIAEAIIHSLNNNLSNSDLCQTISTLMPKWKNQFLPAITETKEDELPCGKEIQSFIIKALEFMKTCLSTYHYDIAYDITDLLQGLYGIILTNSKKSFKQYWKTYIKPFQKKWNLDTFHNFKTIFYNQNK